MMNIKKCISFILWLGFLQFGSESFGQFPTDSSYWPASIQEKYREYSKALTLGISYSRYDINKFPIMMSYMYKWNENWAIVPSVQLNLFNNYYFPEFQCVARNYFNKKVKMREGTSADNFYGPFLQAGMQLHLFPDEAWFEYNTRTSPMGYLLDVVYGAGWMWSLSSNLNLEMSIGSNYMLVIKDSYVGNRDYKDYFKYFPLNFNASLFVDLFKK